MRVLGVMSGTSMDAVDYVVCRVNRKGAPRLERHWSVRFPGRLAERLAEAARNRVGAWEVAQLHHDLGRFYAKGARKGMGVQLVELAGLHGQTIFHHPREPAPATFQIGEPAYLSEALGVSVVSNFRAADLAAGGQGAPLATVFHERVFAERGRVVAVQNLGGIGNVTWLDWREASASVPRVMAFDTGPANILLNLAMSQLSNGSRRFDRNGAWARRGLVDAKALADWLQHPYFRIKPPKSTGRELFGESFLEAALRRPRRAEDLLASLTELTALSISLNYERHLPALPERVILCGGGAKNRFLVARIASALRELSPAMAVHSSAEFGWDPQVIEASAFALLAWLSWHNQPGNLPETTGASGSRVLGQITARGGVGARGRRMPFALAKSN